MSLRLLGDTIAEPAMLAVRPAASFPGLDERHVRIAVRPRTDNAVLAAALAEALA